MLRITSILLAVISAFEFAVAANIEGRVSWNEVCTGYSSLGHSKVVLDGGRHTGSIRRDGSFQIPDVEEGSYILSVLSHDYAFDSLRIDVHPSGESLPDIRPYVPGTPHNPPSVVSLHYPIVLHPRQKAEYFVEPQSFNALGMLQNPMMLMMAVTGGLVLAMPYIMKNLDPEVAKEVSERQVKYASIQNAMTTGDFRGGLSALMAPDSEPERPSAQDSSRKASTQAAGPARSKGGSSRGGRRK